MIMICPKCGREGSVPGNDIAFFCKVCNLIFAVTGKDKEFNKRLTKLINEEFKRLSGE